MQRGYLYRRGGPAGGAECCNGCDKYGSPFPVFGREGGTHLLLKNAT